MPKIQGFSAFFVSKEDVADATIVAQNSAERHYFYENPAGAFMARLLPDFYFGPVLILFSGSKPGQEF